MPRRHILGSGETVHAALVKRGQLTPRFAFLSSLSSLSSLQCVGFAFCFTHHRLSTLFPTSRSLALTCLLVLIHHCRAPQTNADSCTAATECKFGQVETQGARCCGPQEGGDGGQQWMHCCLCVTCMSSCTPPPVLNPLHLPLILSTQRPRRGPIACASTAISASHSTANRRCACCGEAKKCVCVSRPKVDGVEKRR